MASRSTAAAAAIAAGGFLLGTVVTIAVNYVAESLLERRKRRAKARKSVTAAAIRSRSIKNRSLLGDDDDSMTQLRRSAYAVASLEADGIHSSGFLTDIVAQLWSYINVAGSDMIKEMVEPMFNMMPKPLKSLHFTKLDLGAVPMRLDNIVVHALKDGIVQFDIDVIWDGDCDIDLHANYFGSFGVESVKLTGRMSILLSPLTNVLPVVSAVQYAFINPPNLELTFTGLAQVAEFSIVERSVRKIIQDLMASMVVLPNRMIYKMDLSTHLFDIYKPPIGIAHITAIKGRGFQVELKVLGKDDVPDVYCKIKLGSSPNVWRTSTIKDDLTPEWNESVDFLLSDYDQLISIDVWDEDRGIADADDYLGSAEVTVGEVLLENGTMELALEHDGKCNGAFITLRCDVCELTPDIGSFKSPAHQGENMLCGLVTILVSQAFNVPLKKEEASTFVQVNFGSCEFFTGVVVDCPGYDALNPTYDCVFHVPLTTDLMGDIVFTLMNGETSLGTSEIPYALLLSAPDKTFTDKRKIGDQGASLEFRVSVSGIKVGEYATKSSLLPTTSTLPKSSVPRAREEPSEPSRKSETVRLTAVKGRGFKIQKSRGLRRKVDIPDVYLEIKFGAKKKAWRTSTIRNDTKPEWNESSDFPLSNLDEIISIDVWDEDKGISDPDDHLGSATITVGELLSAEGMTEVPLRKKKGKETGFFVTLRCDRVLGI